MQAIDFLRLYRNPRNWDITVDTGTSITAVNRGLNNITFTGSSTEFLSLFVENSSISDSDLRIVSMTSAEFAQLKASALVTDKNTLIRVTDVSPNLIYEYNSSTWVTSTGLNQAQLNAGAKNIAGITDRGSLIDKDGNLIDNNGIFIASETWDLGWRAKLKNSASALAQAAFCGDSNTQGWWASNLDTKTFVGLVRKALQDKYGNGGSGFKGSAYSGVSALAGNANFMATVAASSFFALTGTWTQNTSILDGPGTNLITANSVGATATYTVYGDTVNVYFATGIQSSFGQYEVSIDGGAFTTPVSTQTGVETLAIRTFTGLVKGNHTVVVRATDANGTIQFFFCGVEGMCSTGVAVHNYGRGGFPSLAISNLTGAAQQFTTTGGQAFATSTSNGSRAKGGQWSGGSKKPADLICVAYGINDARFTTPVITPQSYMDNIRRYIEDVRDGTSADGTTGNPNASIILMLCPRWAQAAYSDSGKSTFVQFGQQLLTLAKEFDCAFVNTWAIQRNSYNYALSNGWVGNANNAGAPGTDQLHGSDAWHQKVADILIPRII